MTDKIYKTFFTQDELRQIIPLVAALEKSEKSRKKGIRDKLRKLGLHWLKVRPHGKYEYTVDNLKHLFENGDLQLEGYTPSIPKTQKGKENVQSINRKEIAHPYGRQASDEHYVIDLCDEILGVSAKRQHRFDFLRGDTGVALPVDAYYPSLNLVIEYHEPQHTQSTPFFDNKPTASGVSRGEQRRIYDKRRQQVLPEYGIKLIVISYTDFGPSKRLSRNKEYDKQVVKKILSNNGIIK